MCSCTRSHPDSRASLGFCGARGRSGSRGNRCTPLDQNGRYTVAHRGRQHTHHSLQKQMRHFIRVNTRKHKGESHIHLDHMPVTGHWTFSEVKTRESTQKDEKPYGTWWERISKKYHKQIHKTDIQTVSPTFRNALAQHKLEALATFLSAKYQMDMHIRQIQNTLAIT